MQSAFRDQALVSVVIPCHNGVDDTRQAIRSLLAQESAPPLEIVIVDNGGSDATRDLGREFPGVQVLRSEQNLGFAGGVNRGIAAARGEQVLVLNNDTAAAPRMLARLAAALASDPRIAMAAPVSNHVKGTARLPIGGLGATAAGRQEIEAALGAAGPGRIEDVDTLAGLCLLFPRALLQQIGGAFDERFGLGNFEDDDFCLRARLAGRRLVLVRDAFLHHEGHKTFHALQVDYKQLFAEKAALFRAKWQGVAAAQALFARADGDFARASLCAEMGLAEHPNWPDGHWILALQRLQQNLPAAAIAHLQRFLALCPAHGEAAVTLALQTLRLGDEATGTRLFADALERCHLEEEFAARSLAAFSRWLLDQKRPEEAAAHLRTASAIAPQNAEIENLLGVALMDAGALAEAVAALQAAEARGSRNSTKNLGICLWRQHRHDEALRVMARAVAQDPTDPGARSNLDSALRALRAQGIVVADDLLAQLAVRDPGRG